MTTRGITVLAGGLAETRKIAKAAEAAGFDATWSGEFLNRSAVVSVAAMAAATTKIGVGTAIAYAVGRSPLVLANDARFLDEMSDGRLTLGLGTGTRGMSDDDYLHRLAILGRDDRGGGMAMFFATELAGL